MCDARKSGSSLKRCMTSPPRCRDLALLLDCRLVRYGLWEGACGEGSRIIMRCMTESYSSLAHQTALVIRCALRLRPQPQTRCMAVELSAAIGRDELSSSSCW